MLRLTRRFLVVLLLLAPCVPQSAAAQASDPLRPGDVVRLRIWREPDLSGEFTVDEMGMVVLPKVGPMKVGGESPEAVESRVVRAFGEFLQHDAIEVRLLRRVQVLGAVRNPGLYPVDATMTLADALALAGGTTPEGHPQRVYLIRGGKRLDVPLAADMKIAGSPIRSGDQIFVPERSWVSRNAGVVAAGLTAGVSLLLAFVR